MTDILCTSCSEPAVKAMTSGEMAWIWGYTAVNELECRCVSCDAPGKVEQVDDGEQAMLVFRVENSQ